MDRGCATEIIDTGSILVQVKPKTIKLVFTAFLPDVQQLKGQCELKPPPFVVDRWQLDSKTERSLHCLQDKASW